MLLPKRRRLGFTLIELLVVIAIIAILIAILLPSLNKARQMAVRTQCASNMHQIYLALYMYANDNSGHYPTGLGVGGGSSAFCYWWQEPLASVVTSYIGGGTNTNGNNWQVLYCPSWAQNTVYYGDPILSADDGNYQAASQYWWFFGSTPRGTPPPGGVYPAGGYSHIVSYEVMCNAYVSSIYIDAPTTQTNHQTSSSVVGTVTNPPPPTTSINGSATVSYYIQRNGESGNKVLIADDTSWQMGGVGWQDWDVAHASPGGKTPPLGANHCNMDGSVSWNGTDAMQMRWGLANGATKDYWQEWW